MGWAVCSQVEQPAGEQDRRSSRIAAPSRIWCDPVTELCYVLFGPVVDPTAAGTVASPHPAARRGPLHPRRLLGLDEFSHLEVVFVFDRVAEDKIEYSAGRPRNNPEAGRNLRPPKARTWARCGYESVRRLGVD